MVLFTRSMAKREVTFFSGTCGDQAAVEIVIFGHRSDRDAEQIIDVAGHPVDLHHLGHRRDRGGEAFSQSGE